MYLITTHKEYAMGDLSTALIMKTKDLLKNKLHLIQYLTRNYEIDDMKHASLELLEEMNSPMSDFIEVANSILKVDDNFVVILKLPPILDITYDY